MLTCRMRGLRITNAMFNVQCDQRELLTGLYIGKAFKTTRNAVKILNTLNKKYLSKNFVSQLYYLSLLPKLRPPLLRMVWNCKLSVWQWFKRCESYSMVLFAISSSGNIIRCFRTLAGNIWRATHKLFLATRIWGGTLTFCWHVACTRSYNALNLFLVAKQ